MSKVFFVGCGPGDPELITIKAKKLIQKADVVVYSGSLIPEPILKFCKKGKLYDAAKLVREEIFDLLYKNAKKDKLVIRLHDGDPSIYGAIKEQIDNLEKKGIKSIVVPGITAFLASAAALGTQLTLPGVTQTIIVTRVESRTKVPKREKISELAKHKATLIFYLSVHLLSKLVKEAILGGYKKNTSVAVVYRASWDDQKIIKGTLNDIVEKIQNEKITRTAIVIISDVIEPESYEYSRLYDKEFSHGYRKSKTKRTKH
ncbi:precorrin-4 C(11)-methyltransferase [Nitrosopumilus sp.]|uniref:precorrin-4 C(11)-methyltransferase n=1 Tax=Nitrosopumilus sp. TaxID=2024843 RepID=UPI00292DB110|nr:precorrin-4 C(11)-methyltransferase [Nitrosopumilus sp.]